MLVLFFPAFLLLMTGVLIKYLKWYWLIADYNTVSKEKKRNVDVAGLGHFLGNGLFTMAGSC